MPQARRSRVAPRRSANEGLGNVDAILARQAEKRAAGRTGWVKVSDDEEDPTIIRAYDASLFREGYIHQVEFEIEVEDRQKRGKMKTITVRRDRMCLDQEEDGEPCPGCRDELERRYKFWLPVIWRDAPVEVDGKVKGFKDRVALLSGGSRLVAVINRIQKKKGLVKQDVELNKSGEGFNVQYVGEALAAEVLSADDKALIKAFDANKLLDRYTEVLEFDDFYNPPGSKDDDEEESVGERSRRRGSAFPARGKKTQRDDDDDGDDAPRPRRSGRGTAGSRKPGGLASLLNNKDNGKSSGTPQIRSGGTTRRRRTR
jgi:hypothetical protein